MSTQAPVDALRRPREWVPVSLAAITDTRLSAGAVRVLLAILSLTDRWHRCDATTFELACMLEAPEQAVKAHVRLLSELRYLVPCAVRGNIGWRVHARPCDRDTTGGRVGA